MLADVAREFEALTGARVEVRPVVNTLFGERVNVSGLLCGRDFVTALAGANPDVFILPRPSLDYFGQKFLDSQAVAEVEAQLGAPLAFASQWSEVAEIMASGPRPPHEGSTTNGVFWSEPAAAR